MTPTSHSPLPTNQAVNPHAAQPTSLAALTDSLWRTGLLFPPGDIHALTRALESLLDDTSLRQKMGEAARQRVQSLFSSHEITQKMLAFYRGILENNNDQPG